MVRKVTIGDKEFAVNLGMTAISEFFDESGINPSQIDENYEFFMKEILQLFAIGIKDAARLRGKKKHVTWQQIGDLCDANKGAFAKISELIGEELGHWTENVTGEKGDVKIEEGKDDAGKS